MGERTSDDAATSGAAAYIKSFALKAPTSNDKPAVQKRKGAFDKVAKKQQPKPAFSSANVGKKPGAKDEQPEGDTVVTRDSKLQLWLKAGNGDRPGCEEAREYLLRGIPYRGFHAPHTKEAVKEVGGTWLKNALKVGEMHDGVSFGWYCAYTEQVLIDLINMPRIARDRPYWDRGKGKWKADETQPQWTPLDVPEKSFDTVVLLVLEYEADVKERQEIEMKAASNARNAKEMAKLNSQRNNNIPLDAEEHIGRIKQEWDIDWTPAMGMAASRCIGLGPHSGVSPVFRAIRGLHLGVCTPEEVRIGEYHSDAAYRAKARTKMMADADGEMVYGDEDYIDYTRVPITSAYSGCYMFGKGRGMIPLATEAEWLRRMEADTPLGPKIVWRGDMKLMPPKLETWCTSCVCKVIEQFNDCSCYKEETPCVWQWCSECRCAYNSHQPCVCNNADQWQNQQNKTIEEAERRAEKAERDAQLAESLGAMTAPIPVGLHNNQPEEGEEAQDMGETLDDFWGL